MYPGIRDVVLAQKALRAQIYRQRQLLRRDVFGSAPKKVATVMIAKSPLNSSERSIFGALFEAELAPSAFSICSDADVFESDQGRALATKLHQTFSVFPGDHAAVWLPKLEDPELQQLLSDCGQSDFPLTAAILLGECKWTREPLGASVVRELIEDKAPTVKIDANKPWQYTYAFFSKSGFTPEARAAAKGKDCIWVDLSRLDDQLTE